MRWWAATMLVVAASGCGDDGVSVASDSESTGGSESGSEATGSSTDSGESSSTTDVVTVHIEGALQKGPFLEGSSVLVGKLSPTGLPVDEPFSTLTTNDYGRYGVDIDAAGPIVILGTGSYYNEVVGAVSDAEVTLRAHYVASGAAIQEVNVNVITHVSTGRLRRLAGDGDSYEEAIAQAEEELRVALGIGLASFDPEVSGTAMDVLGGNTPGNAYLLAVSSVILQAAVDTGDPVDGAVQDLLDALSGDFEDDGAIRMSLRQRIDAAELALDVDAVTADLAARIESLGASIEIPNMHDVLDQDDDHLVNRADNCDQVPNFGQEDGDFDSVGDVCDNCPFDANPEQEDSTGTGVGDACNNTCGDAFVGPFEACDDGANGDDSDRCTDFCTLPFCGDGIPWANEECDDGNFVDGDGCNLGCVISGGIVWQVEWNTAGVDRCNGLAADSSGGVVIGGQQGTSGFLQTYDTDGNPVVDEPQTTSVLDVGIFPNGDILLLLDESPASLQRVDPAGAPIWTQAGTVDVAGVLEVNDATAYYIGGANAASSPIVAQYSGVAVEEWTYLPALDDAVVDGLALTFLDEVVFGISDDELGTSSAFLGLVDAAGAEQWSIEVDTPGDTAKVAVGGDGTIAVLYTGANAEAFVRAYNFDGSTLLWSFDPEGDQDQAVGDVAIDLYGHIAVAHQNAPDDNGRITKLAPLDGAVIWEEVIDEPGRDYPYRVAFDAAGSLFACVRTDDESDPGVLLIELAP